MRIYEELFIMKPDVPEEEITAFIDQISAQITTAGGTVDKVENWGKRRLAYKVEKFKEGNYVLIQFSSEATTVVKELERRLRVADSVIKFLTVRIDETLKRIEKRKKERDKRAHRRGHQPPPGYVGPTRHPPVRGTGSPCRARFAARCTRGSTRARCSRSACQPRGCRRGRKIGDRYG